MRYIGVDLHTTQITVCYLTETGKILNRRYGLEQLSEFCADLKDSDQVAVEATGNTAWFVAQVRGLVSRVVIVNPAQFQVIRRSVKKTDRNDAVALARFLKADLLPEVREKSEAAQRVQSLNQTRADLVQTRTRLINKIHGLLVSRGRREKRERLTTPSGLQRVINQEWSKSERLELEVVASQIKSLNEGIKQLDRAIEEMGEQLNGFENLVSIKGIGKRSAAILLSVIGAVEDFESADKLASYFGIVPRVANSNETVKTGRIHKRGSKTGRTTLVQCTLVALRYSEYLQKHYAQVKERRGAGKAIIAAARKFLGIIYNTLKEKWVFVDFGNFVLAE